MKRIELVDFLKGFSIFTIVMLHLLQGAPLIFPLDKAILLGGTGVHLFVLLSGFGLALSQRNKPLSWPAFLRKRALKIYGPYAGLVLVTAGLSLVLPLFPGSWYALGGHLFLYKMFDESIMTSYGYQLWFVSMIIQFYLVFHGLTFLRQKVGSLRSFLVIAVLASLCWSVSILAAGLESYRVWNSFFLQFLWEFALGMALAELYQQNRLKEPPDWAWLSAGLAGIAVFGLMALKGGAIGKVLNDIPALIGYGSLAVWLYRRQWKPVNGFFLFTATVSYELFLVHMLVIQLVGLMFKAFDGAPLFTVPLSLVLSYGSAWVWAKAASGLARR